MNLTQTAPNFNPRQARTCVIGVPNLKEIDPWEGYFYAVQKNFLKRCEEEEEEEKGEEKCEENWTVFESAYLVYR